MGILSDIILVLILLFIIGVIIAVFIAAGKSVIIGITGGHDAPLVPIIFFGLLILFVVLMAMLS